MCVCVFYRVKEGGELCKLKGVDKSRRRHHSDGSAHLSSDKLHRVRRAYLSVTSSLQMYRQTVLLKCLNQAPFCIFIRLFYRLNYRLNGNPENLEALRYRNTAKVSKSHLYWLKISCRIVGLFLNLHQPVSIFSDMSI